MDQGSIFLKIYVHVDFTASILPYHFIAITITITITITMMALDFIRKKVLNINVGKSSKIYLISRFS